MKIDGRNVPRAATSRGRGTLVASSPGRPQRFGRGPSRSGVCRLVAGERSPRPPPIPDAISQLENLDRTLLHSARHRAALRRVDGEGAMLMQTRGRCASTLPLGVRGDSRWRSTSTSRLPLRSNFHQRGELRDRTGEGQHYRVAGLIDGALEGMVRLALVQADQGTPAHVGVRGPLDHGQGAFDAADFSQRRRQLVLARLRGELAQ